MSLPKPGERAIFNDARGIAATEARRRYVEKACGEDQDLQARIEALLRVHAEDQSFLRCPAEGVRAAFADPVREGPGTGIGPYQLRQQLGEGGMGTVWMAEQSQPVQRQVALKIIKPGMNSRQVLPRFEAERQALALMDHPNIAKVLDAGTIGPSEPRALASGEAQPLANARGSERPYFVMELVQGVPITKYCDERRLTPRQRLELFVHVCQGIQHAHQKGVIHRDLKPSNVLVATYDGKPVPKIIDFGVAKATGQKLTEQTLVTEFGLVIGTPDYMSPEQAEPKQLDIDTRSDIYSLGVLLYELLTGATPLRRERMEATGLLELLRVIREEEPSKPSARLSTTEELPSIAANRGLEPKKLRGLLQGDLDWIVMKCLEKERARRYETADGLARDIERYLRDEPVEASPPGAGYRLRKFVKRNKGRVVAAGLVLVALWAGMAGTTWGLIRAEQARQNEAERAEGERQAKEEAQRRLAQIEKGTEILASVFRDLDPNAAEKEGVTLRVLLGRRLGEAAQQLEGEAVGDPLVVARLQHVLGISLRELGHRERAEVVLVKASQTRERLLGADHLDTVATKHHLAVLHRAQGKYTSAEALYKEVLAIRTARLGADHPDNLTSQHDLAMLYHSQGKYALAEALYKEVLTVRTARLGADHPDTLTSGHRLALLYRNQAKYALAEALGKEVLAIRTARLGADHLDTVATKSNLAVLYRAQGNYALAEALCKEVLAVRIAKLGIEHPDTLASRQHLADLYHSQGNYALAEGLSKEVLAIRTAKLGADHPNTLHSQDSLAAVYWSMKKLEQSIPLLEETLKLRRAKLSPDHPDTLLTQANLGVNCCDAGRFADAIALLEEVHQKAGKEPQLAWVGNALLTAYVRAGKKTEATALAREQVQAATEALKQAAGCRAAPTPGR